ncbi:hypothetical protein ElyMa_001964600 [Elysia marginata]|uniref:Uncharacterized protein n=1 Tax=Elysia marginata TaxID=1093978 RepID=A0AAV4F0A1_9GAST|nr:hypothetical protein ElyMa_001964600 [Elysia marginata]
MGHTALPSTIGRSGRSSNVADVPAFPCMLMGTRRVARRQTHLNHQDSCPAAHGSHLTANKVPNSRERSRFRGIEESRQNDISTRGRGTEDKARRIGPVLSSLLLCHARQAYGAYHSLLPSE